MPLQLQKRLDQLFCRILNGYPIYGRIWKCRIVNTNLDSQVRYTSFLMHLCLRNIYITDCIQIAHILVTF